MYGSKQTRGEEIYSSITNDVEKTQKDLDTLISFRIFVKQMLNNKSYIKFKLWKNNN